MSALILTLLKYGLLALLYLFFARVLFSVWSELRPTGKHSAMAVGAPGADLTVGPSPRATQRVDRKSAPTSSRRAGRRAQRRPSAAAPAAQAVGQLLVVAPEAGAGQTYALGQEITVGRALGSGVPIDDTFVSSLHARLFLRHGAAGLSYIVEDLGSTNGTWLNDKRIDGPTQMHPGDRLRFGATILELR